MTLTFDLVTFKINACRATAMRCTCTSLLLIAQPVFLLERGHTDGQKHTVTDQTDHPTQASATAGVAGKISLGETIGSADAVRRGGRGSVLLWRRWNTLRISGFVDGVVFFLARGVIYTSRAYATMSVSVCLSVCLRRKCIGAL